MQVGEAWWQQIVAALTNEHVEYMILVMTPDAMRSEIVRKEWRRARQEGVCVLPVIAATDKKHIIPVDESIRYNNILSVSK